MRAVTRVLQSLLHRHHHHDVVDRELEASAEGVRAVKVSLLILGVAANRGPQEIGEA